MRVLAFIFIVVLAAGCASSPSTKPATYTVKRGDTLYSIAWRNGMDYRELARINGIGRDYAIRPGQVLRLKSTARVAQQKQTAKSRSTPAASAPVPKGPPVDWAWPTRGTSAALTTRPNGGQGLMIAGVLGQEIRAAGSGRVVYTGSGMLGYGQLVIVKHNDTYLSAYGHTQTITVRENQDVKAGQTIATMGAGPNGSPMLYFEIRVNGQPANPTVFLPK